MKNYILAFTLLLIGNSALFPQYRISLNPGFGYYASNSENSLRMMESQKKYRSYFSFGLSFQKEDLLGYNIMLAYSYNQNTRDKIMRTEWWGGDDTYLIAVLYGSLSFSAHSIDLDYVGDISPNFNFGAGPSIIFASRRFSFDGGIMNDTRLLTLDDRLFSAGLGINAFLMYNIPIIEKLYLTSKIKLRYTHSIWFDKGPRNLDNYSQEFLTTELSAGLGYTF